MKSAKKLACIGLMVCAFQPPARAAVPERIVRQVAEFRVCVEGLSASNVGWLSAMAACSGGNSVRLADACLQKFKRSHPDLNPLVAAMACERGGLVERSSSCMTELYQRYGAQFDPSITANSCAGRSQAASVAQCMNQYMAVLGNNNVIAGIVCAGGNTAFKARACMTGLPEQAAHDGGLASLYEVFAAQACSGGGEAATVAECVRYADGALKNLAGLSGQSDRAAGYACATY